MTKTNSILWQTKLYGEPEKKTGNESTSLLQFDGEQKSKKERREEISRFLASVYKNVAIDNLKLAAKNKHVKVDVDEAHRLYEDFRKVADEVDFLNQAKNLQKNDINSKEELRVRKLTLRAKLKQLDESSEKAYKQALRIPNIPDPSVPIGKDDSENEVIRKVGIPTKFDFIPKNHLELGESLGIIDVERSTKVSGARFGYLKGNAVLLEFALINFAMKTLINDGFEPILPPVLMKVPVFHQLGYSEHLGNENYYYVSADPGKKSKGEEEEGYYLVGTAEHSIVPYYKDEILNSLDMPKRFVGFSTAFRREAGSYGKDTKGLLRVHQFDKIEMISFTKPEDGNTEHEFLLSIEEKLFKALEIPYQVVKMCTGDLGAPAAKKYDLEAWIPSQNKYREVTSTSTCTDFQARRLNIKYRDENKTKYVHTLNGTAFAIGRTIIAILENYQQKDGSIVIPKVLQPYLGKKVIER